MEMRILKARLSFAQGLWNASSAVEGSTKKYNCDFIEVPGSIVQKKVGNEWVTTTLKAAEHEVATEAFKGDKAKADAWLSALDARQHSIRDGDKNLDKSMEVRTGYAGCLYVHPTSVKRMPVYHANKDLAVDEANSPVYPGCYVTGRFSLYANLKPGQKGVFAGLAGVQFTGDGDAFGGGAAASTDDFDEVTVGVDADDFA